MRNFKEKVFIDKRNRYYGKIKSGVFVRIDERFSFTADIELGDYIHISKGVDIIGGPGSKFIARGFNNIMCKSTIICASDRFDGSGLPGNMIPEKYLGTVINKPVVMEMFSNLGSHAVMMPGSRLNTGALLTVGSVLFGDTIEWGIYKGNPARIVRLIDGSKIIEYAKHLGYEL